ncbi:hypothetical protein B0O99DRAFT_747310 [Bisporella sp. PMI_857]|nr:hypothetical protein B0O99DRAFT_747310 [Bisporella sp. PMI_857]
MTHNNRGADSNHADAQWSRLLSEALAGADYKLYEEDGSLGNDTFAAVDITTFQRLSLYHLQRNLSLVINDIVESQEKNSQVPVHIMDQVPELLKSYFIALRDLKWVRECLQDPKFRQSANENLYLHNLVPGVASLLTSSGLFPRHGQIVPPSQACLPRIPKHWDFHGAFVEDHQREQQAFYERLYMAAFGGLHSLAQLVAVLLARFMKDATPKDIMGATAAYAAVLVVFVGTGT